MSFRDAHFAPKLELHLACVSGPLSSGPAHFCICVTIKSAPCDQPLGAFIRKRKAREFCYFSFRGLVHCFYLLMGSPGFPHIAQSQMSAGIPQNLCIQGGVSLTGRRPRAPTMCSSLGTLLLPP